MRQLSSLLRLTAFDSVTCDNFQVRYVQQLSIPLRATAFKSATSNSFRFRYVRQLSSSLRPTAFDSVTCDSFQVCYVQQLSIPLRATAFKCATSNSFRFRYVRQLSSSLRPTAFDTRSVTLPRHKIGCSLYILSQLDHAYSIYFTNDPLILLNDSPGLQIVVNKKKSVTYCQQVLFIVKVFCVHKVFIALFVEYSLCFLLCHNLHLHMLKTCSIGKTVLCVSCARFKSRICKLRHPPPPL